MCSGTLGGRHYAFTLSVIIIVLIALCDVDVRAQGVSPIRSCNDDLIVKHLDRNNHTYCDHACGYLKSATCEPSSGDCLCEYPCSNNETIIQPAFKYLQDICNPPNRVHDPADSDLHFHPRCISRCASHCPGGTGTVCGETTDFRQQNQNVSLYTKICTCHCPIQRCPGFSMKANDTRLVVIVVSSSNTTTNNNTLVAVPATHEPTLITDLVKIIQTVDWNVIVEILWTIISLYGVGTFQIALIGFYSIFANGIVTVIEQLIDY